MNLLLGLLSNMLLAAIPAAGFGMSFNVPRRVLLWCAAGGALGRGLRFLLLRTGMPWGSTPPSASGPTPRSSPWRP